MPIDLTGTAKRRMASKDNWAEFVGVPSVSPGEVTRYEEGKKCHEHIVFYAEQWLHPYLHGNKAMSQKLEVIMLSPWSSNVYLMSMERIHRLPVRTARRL